MDINKDVIEQLAKKAEDEYGKKVLEKAKNNVPVVTGDLKDSGDYSNGVVSFDVDYAINVHENPRSEGYKFLERAISNG